MSSYGGYAKIPADHLAEAEKVLIGLGRGERQVLGGGHQGERVVTDAIAYAGALIELAKAQMMGRGRA